MVNRRKILVALGAGLFSAPLAAGAQPTGKVYRIGFIATAPRNEIEHLIKSLDEGLRELGYVEGRNVVFERRFADGKQERLAALAVELVQSKVDIIVSGSNPVIAAIRQATATIPVVMGVSRDPVGSGFIASLARPGGNITGLANDPAPEIMGKNLELLKEAAPRVSRVAFLWNPVPAGAAIYKNAVETAARNLGVTLQSVEIRAENEFESAFAAMIRERANGVVVTSDPIFLGSRSQLVRLAGRHRLPTVYVQRVCGSRRANVLRGEPRLPVQARRCIRGQNPQGREARRSAGRATDPIRLGREHANGEGPWHQDSQLGIGAGDEGDRVRRKAGQRTAGLAMLD